MKPVDSAAELLRLSARSGTELTSALRELSARGPDAAELASLATRLSLQGIAMTPPAAASPTAGASRRLAWKLGLAGTAALSGLGLWLFLRAATGPRSLDPAPSQVGVGSALQAGRGARDRSAGGELGRAARPSELTPLELSPSSSASPAPHAPEPSASVAALHAVAPDAPRSPEPLPQHEASATKGRSSLAPSLSSNGAELPAMDAARPTELALLRSARLALKGSPAEALRLVEQHRAGYPAGQLTQERELIAISALVALGRRTAALSRATAFEQAFPASPYRKQIGELLQ